MPPALQNVRYPLHIHIAWLFLALIVTFSSISIIYHDRQASRMILSDSQLLFSRIGEQTAQRVTALYDGSGTVVRLLAHHDFAGATTLAQRLRCLPYLAQALASQPAQSAIYAGNSHGDFFLLRRYDPATMTSRFQAPPQTAFLVQSIERNGEAVRGRYLFFDSALRQLAERDDPAYRFDARQRPWYAAALRAKDVAATAPYVFFTTREVGTTVAMRTADSQAVVAVDITLDALSVALARDQVTPGAELALLDASGQVVAYRDPARLIKLNGPDQLVLNQVSGLGVPVLSRLADEPAGTRRAKAGGRAWQGYVAQLPVTGGEDLRLVMAAPEDELLAEARTLRRQTMLIALALAAVMVPLAILLSRLASSPIVALTQEAREIQALRFASPLKVHSFISEIDELAKSMGGMKSTIHQFLHIGSALASEHNFERLLARILRETIGLAGAEGGVVYLRQVDGSLTPAQARWREHTLETALPALGAADEHPVAQAAREGHSIHVTHGLANLSEWYGALTEFEAPMTLIAIPLTDRHGVPVGVLLLLEDDRDGLGDKRKVGRELVALVEAVSGSAAAALQTQRLLAEQKALLEAFIQLVAGAIDAKSPYTGGHCQRVPVLTRMLAEAAVKADSGPLRDFTLNDEQWEALHIAAWLHDCGKVTTPEYVVDKATKLETLYDRIHEVRMRFEVLKRDAELNYWRAVAGGADAAALRPALNAELAALDDDFAFVAACNEGSEEMGQDKVERLHTIAARTWRRTLSDRIGISHEERQRKAAVPEPELPVYEPLLADRPDHLFHRSVRDRLPEGHGFDMAVPEHLYNRGELYNLSVRRGTLTAEERYKINEHIVQTIVMLEKLPFPRHLTQVPELAGGHHEKMDGTGYPRRLTREQMSIPARMMAIADIFEALTAIDRPYKEGKKLSEAVAIMARMARDAHVDADLFRLFIESGVYRDYADAHLRPAQIDEVDEAAVLAGVGEDG
ncbi:HD domain-containing phosphohydrolase [Chitiniphilus shinanonensis]|uniref:HD domain-containing phosphohydrolase n=1 Tax=Chitiniphilus shinanonensis TaxID=553088 RepID=UPI0030729D6A